MSNIKSGIVIVGVSLALALAACAAKPILNVNDSPISTKSGQSPQASQVRQAILTAGVGLGWKIVDVKPGLLEGTLRLREHTAVVEIPYTTKNYSIVFKSGTNLGEKDGQIHKNYNGWVQNLDRGIGVELARL
jgi:hypothetical protein